MNKYLKKFILEVLYMLVSIFYLINLNNLNKELIKLKGIAILQYNNYRPLCYFGGAIVLEIIGFLIIIHLIKKISKKELTEIIDDKYKELIFSLIFITINIFIMYKIIFLIYIPILKAIISFIMIALGVTQIRK